MLLNNLMEGEPITTNNIISSIKHFNSDGKEHGTIKALLKNFLQPEEKMAIKENQRESNNYVYTIPVKPPLPSSYERTKSINEAKLAFLNSTVSSAAPQSKRHVNKQEPHIHYAQIAITTQSEDTRSTGGGKEGRQPLTPIKNKSSLHAPVDNSNQKKKIEQQQQRKVSFKIKNASTSYRRPPMATKTMTITSSKVSELTKKFNNLVNESHNGTIKQSKLAKTIEDLQSASRHPTSNSSTPSSTLSSSPNIKIVLRQKRSSRRRNNKKRCSSMDSIDKLIISDNTSAKFRVIRSKSDGTKIPKSPKKRLKYQDSSEQQSGSDTVDGSPAKPKENITTEEKKKENNVVKNVIKKFECEIIAQSNTNNTLKKQMEKNKSTIPVREKPKVPEKKSSLVLTKNVVVKDGVPKIRTIKPPNVESPPKQNKPVHLELKKKEPIYDRKKYKTNYIHSEKLPLKAVEIIQEDINEASASPIIKEQDLSSVDVSILNEEEKTYQDISSNITPNDSFLWRRKSSTQIYSDSDKSVSDSPYTVINVTMDEVTITCTGDDTTEIISKEESPMPDKDESQNRSSKGDTDSDFESNLVEAYNKEVLVGYTSKPKKEPILEDDYEPLEPRDTENVIVIPIKAIDRSSKINCPLPEIPKTKPSQGPESPDADPKDNIYQCLLEMRSHPEGDESSLHNYEMCDEQLEERTRGDGDSDDGYEYCKSPVKPYCLTSSSGIQIAEGYQPYSAEHNQKNYAISKSVSGTSTVSYEKIGSERIYEKIPPRPPKSKDSSPSYSSRHSFVSSDYTGYNDSENIYDTIKHGDGASLSHCYESIPNSPSMVKLRNNLKKQLASAVQKRLSFDTVSNISQSTMSSEQKTNSIYGQRSVMSYNGQEVAFQVPSSETSASDRSDRSDDWVDVSDEEKNEEQKIIIVRERSRGRKSPVSWSQKVRHQWHKSPKPKSDQECESSESGHLYESLEPAPAPPGLAPRARTPLDDDFDSFDSDSDEDEHDKSTQAPPLPASRLPSPPSGGQYTLTKIASAAQKKMRQIKRNLTKRYTVAMDGKPFSKAVSPGVYDAPKAKSPIYANCERPDIQHPYSNVTFNDTRPVLKTDSPKPNGFREELKTALSEKRLSNGDAPPLPEKTLEKPLEKPTTPTTEAGKKDSGTLSRKAYFSFKSRFRRATSLAVDMNDVPGALKITNSTFYLTDSMDGDSGFSNCSDNGQTGSAETLSPVSARGRRRDGTRRAWADSTPCLALPRPSAPPPPPPAASLAPPTAQAPPTPAVAPPPAAPPTDLSAVNEGNAQASTDQRLSAPAIHIKQKIIETF